MRSRSREACACMRAGISSEKSSSRSWGMLLHPAQAGARRHTLWALHPRFSAGFRDGPDAADVGLALRHADHTTGVEQIEGVARLDALLVGGQHVTPFGMAEGAIHLRRQQLLRFGFSVLEMLEERVRARELEVVA